MDSERDNWINTRAYALWEQTGRPEGRDVEHWKQASEEWEKLNQARLSPASSHAFEDGEEWDD